VLHSRGLIHGDLNLENALLPLRASQANLHRENGIFKPQDPEDEDIAETVRRRDGRDLDKSVPRYLITHESLVQYIALEDDQLRPRLIDAEGQAPETGLQHKTPIILHRPELALEATASHKTFGPLDVRSSRSSLDSHCSKLIRCATKQQPR